MYIFMQRPSQSVYSIVPSSSKIPSCSPFEWTPSFHSQLLATTGMFSSFVLLRISYKWNHTVFNSFRLVSFTQYNYSEISCSLKLANIRYHYLLMGSFGSITLHKVKSHLLYTEWLYNLVYPDQLCKKKKALVLSSILQYTFPPTHLYNKYLQHTSYGHTCTCLCMCRTSWNSL